jgi:hypothetical protein
MALLGNLKGSSQVFQDTEFYNGVATQSLRFSYTTAETWLAKTFSASNRKTHTLSVWIKRSGLGASQNILEARGSGDTGNTDYWFDANDKLEVSGSSTYFRVTTQKFRDVSSWYHLVFKFDTTQSTANDRLLIYVNGSVITSFDTNNDFSQNTDYGINGAVEHRIGDGYGHFEGYMARYEFVDGIALDASYFGETKNGVWIPKQYTGSYGSNGHLLEFKQTGTSANSSGLGADTSGNDHHFTPTAIDASDANMPDSPENNFTTLNSIYGNLSVTLSEGNLKYTTGTSVNPVTGTISIPTTGKWYWEVYVSAVGDAMIGVQNRPDQQANGYSGRKTVYYRQGGSGGGSGSIYIEGTGYGGDQASYTNGDVVSVLYNADDMKIAWYKNGSQEGLTFDVTDTDVMPIVYQASGSGSTSGTFNFGQDSTFAGTISAGGNTDANGIGDFKYTVPSGYLALCSANLPELTIGPNSTTQAGDHFNTLLWSGNSSTQAITGLGFQPDWVWGKSRSGAYGHGLYDTSRGISNVLSAESNNAESSYSSFSSFDSDGFTLGSNALLNESGKTYVAWNWKANGGTTSSNSDGTTTSTVQANTTAGFSIITYTGNATAGATIGHGLGKAPKWVITKARSGSYSWLVGHDGLASDAWTDAVLLDTTDAVSDSNLFWNDTAPNSSVVTLGGAYNPVNGNNVTYVMYAFAEIEGYSKFGSYTGNGSTDGVFIYLGFRPAFVITKQINASGNWIISDSARSPINVGGHWLYADGTFVEDTGSSRYYDFVSNGIKLRNGGTGQNDSGDTYIYMAFAEAPFKFANAR